MSYRLDVVCTDRGNHPRRHLARIVWSPASLSSDGSAAWSPKVAALDLVPDAVAERSRSTRSGGRRHVTTGGTVTTTRADGGRTFVVPPCPSCGRGRGDGGVPIRDDTLTAYIAAVADTPLAGTYDVSALVR